MEWLRALIKVARGDSKTIRITVRDKAGDLAPFNLTNASIYFTAKITVADKDSDAVIAKSTVGGGITVIDASLGIFEVGLTPGDTNIVPMEYIYDVRIAKDGDVYSMEDPGTLKIGPVVRRVVA